MAGRGEAVASKRQLLRDRSEGGRQIWYPCVAVQRQHSEHEIKQAKHMKETFKEILHTMGAVVTHGENDNESNNWGLHAPGNIIHEAGTVRMGNDPKTAPLNKWSQAHEL